MGAAKLADEAGESEAPNDLVRIEPGDYDVVYARHAGLSVFRTAKVRVEFRILAHPDLVLPRWYRVQDFRHGRICAPRHSDIVREISAVLDRRIRHDRIPVASLSNLVVRARVGDVIKDSKQESLAAVNRYSIIQRLLGKTG